jgi:hypothetical protein
MGDRRYMEAGFCHCYGQSIGILSKKKFGSHHWTYPPPWPGRKRHRALCGRLSGSGRGGLPQGSQRTQRIMGMGDRRYMEAGFCHCYGQSVGILSKKKFGSHHWTYPPPWPDRKRHRALCGRLSGAGWGGPPQGSQRTQRTQKTIGMGDCRYMEAVFCHCYGQSVRILPKKKFGSHHWTYPHPWPDRKRHRALCGMLSGSGWGGLSQRSQRTQRIMGMGDRRYMEAVFCHCYGQSVGILSKKKFGSHHWTYPRPWPDRKRHRALCGRLSGSGWRKRRPCRTASTGRLHCDAKSWPNLARPSACRPKPTQAPLCRLRTTSHPRPRPYTHPNGTPESHT